MQTPPAHLDPPRPGDLSGLAIAVASVAVTAAVSIPVITHPLPPLSEMAAALKALTERKAMGKVIVRV